MFIIFSDEIVNGSSGKSDYILTFYLLFILILRELKMNESNGELSGIEKILLKYPGLVMSQSKKKELFLQGPVKVKVKTKNFVFL